MPILTQVAVHPTAFPENLRRDLLQSFRDQKINPKFHYLSYKQSEKWLALHEAHSPARRDLDCLGMYDFAFTKIAEILEDEKRLEVLGLGCGGGQKDVALLKALKGQGTELSYVPCDISLPLVLTAMHAAQKEIRELPCHPMVCDIARAEDLSKCFDQCGETQATRVFAFFGMMPNLEPEEILPKLKKSMRSNDYLLISANLSPGSDYAAGVQKVLPGYDNAMTRDWLLTFLYDHGVEADDGKIRFSVEESKAGIKRIVADYHFAKSRRLTVHGENFLFKKSDVLRLFYSYRHTRNLIEDLFFEYGITVVGWFFPPSEEEGVFLCQTSG